MSARASTTRVGRPRFRAGSGSRCRRQPRHHIVASFAPVCWRLMYDRLNDLPAKRHARVGAPSDQDHLQVAARASDGASRRRPALKPHRPVGWSSPRTRGHEEYAAASDQIEGPAASSRRPRHARAREAEIRRHPAETAKVSTWQRRPGDESKRCDDRRARTAETHLPCSAGVTAPWFECAAWRTRHRRGLLNRSQGLRGAIGAVSRRES
jgi:hypothetical protein